MASKIKVDTLETVNGSGSITLNNPISGFTSTGIDDNATSTAITIDASENVGIGTASPSARFEVEDNGSATGNVIMKVTQDDQSSHYGMSVGNDSYSTVDSDGFVVYQMNNGHTYLYNGGVDEGPNIGMPVAGGITFGNDTAAANTLDDYEEGTFTATLTAVNPPSSPPTATGKYVKVGNMCHFVIYRFDAANTTGASGHMRITGLPFTCGKSTYTSAPFTHGFDFNTARNQFFELNNNNTILYAYESVSGSAWTDWNITVGTGKYMVVSGSYITS